MTEEEWLACDDGGAMLRRLRRGTSARKLRLFAVACHRWRAQHTRKFLRVWHALAAAEELADGKRQPGLMKAGWLVLGPGAYEVAVTTSAGLSSLKDKGNVSLSTQASLLRCIVGNPFRHATVASIRDASPVAPLAESAYHERAIPSGHLDPARLAVLSDALEETGSADAELLAHLRSPGPHVRGCWALDLVLGRK